MTYIQITDLNPSDFELGDEVDELTDEELTDEELLAINGGGFISGAMRMMATTLMVGAYIVDEIL
jgi:hypothetical protein